MAEFTIREARAEERETIRELTLSAYGQFATIMAPSAWPGLQSAILGGLANAEQADTFVAEQGGRIVGSVFLFPPTEGEASEAGRMVWPELRMLAVSPEARGRGIGSALVEACLQRGRERGDVAIGLFTSESMREALRLYARMGFERAPRYDFQPPGGELVMALRKLLAA
jgi:predicted N-acetyltransferase YhbS